MSLEFRQVKLGNNQKQISGLEVAQIVLENTQSFKERLAECILTKDSEEGRLYSGIVVAARNHFIKLHQEEGVELEEFDFPEIFLVPLDKRTSAAGRLGFRSYGEMFGYINSEVGYGISGASRDNVVAVSLGKDLLNNAQSIAHEMGHSIGRKVREIELVPDEPLKVMGQKHGYITQRSTLFLRKFPDHRIHEWGLFLEEAAAEYFSLDFLVETDNPTIAAARNNALAESGEKDFKSFWMKRGSELRPSPKYGLALQFADILVTKGGPEMKKLFLLARTKQSRLWRSKLIKLIDTTFKKGTAKQIIETYFEENHIMSLIKDLKK
ncbi:MAG: hypothetical protein AAB546_03610 [Patescibacteria group bacterium]